jgi:hypothetical protein
MTTRVASSLRKRVCLHWMVGSVMATSLAAAALLFAGPIAAQG